MIARSTAVSVVLLMLSAAAFAAEQPPVSSEALYEVLFYALGPVSEGVEGSAVPASLEPIAARIANDFGAKNLVILGQGMTLCSGLDKASASLNGAFSVKKGTAVDYGVALRGSIASGAGLNCSVSVNLDEFYTLPKEATAKKTKRTKKQAPVAPQQVVVRGNIRNAIGADNVVLPLEQPILIGHTSTGQTQTSLYFVMLLRKVNTAK